MFNREYQKRATQQGLAAAAVRRAGGGHQVAAEVALRLPWAGIFEPWRPFVLVAAAVEGQKKSSVDHPAAKRCKKNSQRLLFDGKLLGLQLSLFPENDVQKTRQSPADSDFPALAAMIDPMATEEDLAAELEKLFPL